MTTDLTIYCHKNPKMYQLSSCSWHCNDETWATALNTVSDILGYVIEDKTWDGEEYRCYSSKLFKLKPTQFENLLIKLSKKNITFSIF